MAQKRPKLVQNMHFWSFWAKYCHFLLILSNAQPKTIVNKAPRWVFRNVGNKTFDFSSKKGFFAQKRPNLARNWHFCPLLAHLVPCWWVGWWLWRGLYLARHLFTLSYSITYHTYDIYLTGFRYIIFCERRAESSHLWHGIPYDDKATFMAWYSL